MAFGVVCFHNCQCYSVCSYSTNAALIFIFSAFILGSPAGILWTIRIIYRFNVPWFEGKDITRIEFPLPPLVQKLVQPVPVELMVGNCGEAKRCAYCHEEFEHDSPHRFCSCCGSATHEDCLELNGGCSIYGCGAKTLIGGLNH